MGGKFSKKQQYDLGKESPVDAEPGQGNGEVEVKGVKKTDEPETPTDATKKEEVSKSEITLF